MDKKQKTQRVINSMFSEAIIKKSRDSFLKRVSIFTDSFFINAMAAIKNNPEDIYKYPAIITKMPDRLKTLELCKAVYQANPKYLEFIPERIQKNTEFIDLVVTHLYAGSVKTSEWTRTYLKYIMCDELYEACQMIEEVNPNDY